MALFASLFFSVPTAVLIWFGLNRELALFWGGFLGASYLCASIAIFALIAMLSPKLFTTAIGAVWRGMVKIEKWWGW